MPPTVRTFIAVEITPEIRQQAVRLIGRLRSVPVDVKWVGEENLHFTIKFLGDVETTRIAEVCHAAESAVQAHEPFRIDVRTAGAFPKIDRPRTLWLGMDEGTEPMRRLHADLEAALDPLGFAPERRRFDPHLTIGRVRRGGAGTAELAERLEGHQDFAAGSMTVSELVVFSSRLDHDGPTYAPLGHARLGAK